MAIAGLALSFAIEGSLVNSKKVRRLMRTHDRKPKRRKRFVAELREDHHAGQAIKPQPDPVRP
jgi:hypothetical protein